MAGYFFGGFGDLGGHTGGFEFGKDVDAPLVPGVSTPRLVEEGVDDCGGFRVGVHATGDADELGIIVLSSQSGGLYGPGQGAASALDFIGSDLFPVTGAAQHDPKRPGVVNHPLGGRNTKCWVIVVGIVGVGAAVDYFVSSRQQVVLDSVFEFKACMICTKVNSHKCSLTAGFYN